LPSIGQFFTFVLYIVAGGSVLGPNLFLLYINDVVDTFSGLCVSVSLFDDDVKLYTCYQLDASHNDLQTAIDRLVEWAKLWQISIPKCLAFRIVNTQWRISND